MTLWHTRCSTKVLHCLTGILGTPQENLQAQIWFVRTCLLQNVWIWRSHREANVKRAGKYCDCQQMTASKQTESEREREKQTNKLGAQRHCPVRQEHGLCRVYQYMEQQNEIHVFESYRLFITLGLSTLQAPTGNLDKQLHLWLWTQ